MPVHPGDYINQFVVALHMASGNVDSCGVRLIWFRGVHECRHIAAKLRYRIIDIHIPWNIPYVIIYSFVIFPCWSLKLKYRGMSFISGEGYSCINQTAAVVILSNNISSCTRDCDLLSSCRSGIELGNISCTSSTGSHYDIAIHLNNPCTEGAFRNMRKRKW